MKPSVILMLISISFALLAFLSSCDESAAIEADKLRDELETQENLTEADRNSRERENGLEFDHVKNEPCPKNN